MKKITLLLACVAMSAVSFAQIVDRPFDGPNSIIAVDGTDGSQVYCADYFSTASDFVLGDITVRGTNSNDGLIAPFVQGFDLFIYADAAGVPAGDPTGAGAAAVFELDNIAPGELTLVEDGIGGSEVSFNISNVNGSDYTLPAGDYWLVAAPRVDDPLAAGRWNWGLSLATPAIEPVLIDPGDLFGLGVTSWTNITSIVGFTSSSFSWTLEEQTLGVDDNNLQGVSVFPNPVKDVLNVTLPQGADVTSAQVFDILGRDTGLKMVNGAINTAGLSNGVYVFVLNTTEGNFSTRIVKQ